jgi:hypothetical protein
MRHLQGALSSWCEPAFSNTDEYEIHLAEVGAHVAQGIAKLADRLEEELNFWQGGKHRELVQTTRHQGSSGPGEGTGGDSAHWEARHVAEAGRSFCEGRLLFFP